MKARIAIATVSGKPYYLIVNELKTKNVPFVSLTPQENIPVEVKVVITTEEEAPMIRHERVLIYKAGIEPAALINEALQIAEGRETFEKVTIGVDPGDVFGLAVLAGGKVIETENCYSVEETLQKIEKTIRNLEKTSVTSISVKIGDGVPACRERLLQNLDRRLPAKVVLESVKEAGTNRTLNEAKHRRGLRDIMSAIQIAGRSGQTFQRRKTDEPYS
jgi:hypothetical protein